MAEYELNERQKSAFRAANKYAASCNQDPICFAFVEGAKWADTHKEEELHHFLEGVGQFLKERAIYMKAEYRGEEAIELLKRLMDIAEKKNWQL